MIFKAVVLLFLAYHNNWSFFSIYLIIQNSKCVNFFTKIRKILILLQQVRNWVRTLNLKKPLRNSFLWCMKWNIVGNHSELLNLKRKYHYDLLRPLEAELDFTSNHWTNWTFSNFYCCMQDKNFVCGAFLRPHQVSMVGKKKLTSWPPFKNNDNYSTFWPTTENWQSWGQNRGQF